VGEAAEPSQMQAALESNPELRQAWEDAKAYRETFATPEQAQTASALVADLQALDALFFSGRREDHATLAQKIAMLDPVAFKSLAQAMGEIAAGTVRPAAHADSGAKDASGSEPAASSRAASIGQEHHDQAAARAAAASDLAGTSPEFLQAANAAAVESVLGAINSQVQRLLPEEVPTAARNRVVGEIYRELDRSLSTNREFARQMREAVTSGSRDAEHQQAIVSLVTGRARQALPAIAKKVLNEWTSTIVAANHERRARQRVAERRVDIVGSGRSGSDGHRTMTPHDIDYARMSDADILNL